MKVTSIGTRIFEVARWLWSRFAPLPTRFDILKVAAATLRHQINVSGVARAVAVRAPDMNAVAERFVGSSRREVLDHVSQRMPAFVGG